ncbi:MAG TPA: hypothetical protein PKD05_12190 [Candidatus Melainabacteria bacterium]|nr:hypothetical protein [Candidatus Melainabacteria bacterium]HMP52303.1 hypothetical protein [Candidatus Melainabacteria bacterium]
MKSSHAVLLSLSCLLAGIIAGPTIKEVTESRQAGDKRLSELQQELITRECRDSFATALVSQYGPAEKASEYLVKNIDLAVENRMNEYRAIKLIELMRSSQRSLDFRQVEKRYEDLVQIYKESPSIEKSTNMKLLSITAFGHCLAGQNATLRKEYTLAEHRYERALDLVKDIDDLNWLRFYIVEQQAKKDVIEEKYDQALKAFEEVLDYRNSRQPNSAGGISRLNLLVNLCYLAHKLGDKEKLKKFVNVASSLPEVKAREKGDPYWAFFRLSTISVGLTEKSEDADTYMERMWRTIIVNSN